MKRQTSSHNAILRIARGGLIAALYVALTYLASMLGLSSGVIQFRLSEALCIMPIFLPEAIPALALGCLIANAATGCLFWDVIFGALATLIGAIGAYLLRKAKHTWLTTLPTVISNAVIIPFVLLFVYEAEGGYFFFMATVAIGEIVCATILGTLFAKMIKKTKLFDDLQS